MKHVCLKIILLVIVALLSFSCSSSKELRASQERLSLMMPRTSDLPRNQGKYTEVSYKKRNKEISKRQKKMNKRYKRYKYRF